MWSQIWLYLHYGRTMMSYYGLKYKQIYKYSCGRGDISLNRNKSNVCLNKVMISHNFNLTINWVCIKLLNIVIIVIIDVLSISHTAVARLFSRGVKIIWQVVRILPSPFPVTCSPYKEIHVTAKGDSMIQTTCQPFWHPRKIVGPRQCLWKWGTIGHH